MSVFGQKTGKKVIYCGVGVLVSIVGGGLYVIIVYVKYTINRVLTEIGLGYYICVIRFDSI